MSAQLSSFQLNNGVAMPAVGLGVFQSGPQETVSAVSTALQYGYRMIDTAAAYANEAQVGQGIRGSGIARNDVFVTTKLKPADYSYDSALRVFDALDQNRRGGPDPDTR